MPTTIELADMSVKATCSFILLFSCINSLAASASHFSNDTDKMSLLAFKEQITHDPLGALTSWNASLHFCKWNRVTCSLRHQRVTALNFSSQSLSGSISPHIGNLSFLMVIDFTNNSFSGEIPLDVSRLPRLKILGLSTNSLGGAVPGNLSRCRELRVIDLTINDFVGNIPVELGSLSNLLGLFLSVNSFSGSIPPSLGNLSALIRLSLNRNNLEGSIPEALGNLDNLQLIQFSGNRLSGLVPRKIYNLSSLFFLSLGGNQLSGSLPPTIGLTLPNLQYLGVGGNQFAGSIPVTLSNSSKLILLDFSQNKFSGPVSVDLGLLPNLSWLNVGANRLGGFGISDLSFVTSLTNCSSLTILGLDSNRFEGTLPNSIANLSTQLTTLALGRNQINGAIPVGIENLISLARLDLEHNFLVGGIPEGIGKLQRLADATLNGNKLSGKIPSSFGNISQLLQLYLEENELQGAIPSSIGSCGYLQVLNLSWNNLSGIIPIQVLSLPSLSISLSLAHNSFSGTLPSEVGNLKNVQELDFSYNHLSGELPGTLGNCLGLESLHMESNSFEGSIPPSLSSLKGIRDMDFSHNNLSGSIPEYLERLPSLQRLNLSFNDFQGQVPRLGIFSNSSAVSVLGNANLCGGIPEFQLPECPTHKKKKGRRLLALFIAIPLASLALLLLLIATFLLAANKRRKSRNSPHTESMEESRYPKVSYAELHRATDGFSSANLIGVGAYGSVYRGIMGRDERHVAVKVLNLQRRGASRSFNAECEALRTARHRNLVRIITTCSSLDFEGKEFKALVLEFMPKGNLEEWLYPHADRQGDFRKPNLIQRISIASDVASALEYLHHHCPTPVVHCDLNPRNILLDDDACAHLSDFGLARLLHEKSAASYSYQTSSVLVKGSIGYVAPEYGTGGSASTKGDVYSYGILLLEMLTGKRPTDDIFQNGLDLHMLAQRALPDKALQIIDPPILEEEDDDSNKIIEKGSMGSRAEDCLITLIRLGISCSSKSPRDRMDMRDVAREVHEVKKLLVGS